MYALKEKKIPIKDIVQKLLTIGLCSDKIIAQHIVLLFFHNQNIQVFCALNISHSSLNLLSQSFSFVGWSDFSEIFKSGFNLDLISDRLREEVLRSQQQQRHEQKFKELTKKGVTEELQDRQAKEKQRVTLKEALKAMSPNRRSTLGALS